MRGYWLLGAFALGATLLSAGKADALQCNPPPSYVLWTYPNASTEVVPTNAVFWVLGYVNRIMTLEIDGVEIPSLGEARGLTLFDEEALGDGPRGVRFQRRYDFPFETAQFVPAEPLTPGEHEVVIRALDYGLRPEAYFTTEAYGFTVRAEERAPEQADVTITAVTGYAWDYEFGPPAPDTFPPTEAISGVCDLERVPLDAIFCDYGTAGWPPAEVIEGDPATRVVLPRNVSLTARFEIVTTGAALGHLVGSTFVPAGCSSFFGSGTTISGGEQGSVTSFYAQPVLANGLGTPRAFTGEVELIEGIGTPPVYDLQEPSGWCSLGVVGAHTSRSDLAALALFVTGGALLRRSRGARQLPPRA